MFSLLERGGEDGFEDKGLGIRRGALSTVRDYF